MSPKLWCHVSAMRLHEDEEGLQTRACGALSAMADLSAENATMAGNAGAIESVVAAMRKHVAVKTTHAMTSRALNTICYCNAENIARAVVAGATDTIVVGMCQHPEDTILKEQGCESLGAVTFSDWESGWNHTENVIGAINAVVTAMHGHLGAEEVQLAVISCLLISLGDGLDGMCIWAEQLGKAGVVEAVLAAQNEHKRSKDIQSRACRLLRFLIGNCVEENLTRASNAGVIEATLMAMRTHIDNVGLQQEACAVLRVVIDFGDVEQAVHAADEGAADTLVATMRQHEADNGVQRQACGVLRTMSSGNTRP